MTSLTYTIIQCAVLLLMTSAQRNWISSRQNGCFDIALNCLDNLHFCGQFFYESIMRTQCARTCRFCHVNQNFDPMMCRDTNPECQLWSSRGFCDSFFYPEHLKRRYCALSCGYCGSLADKEPYIDMEWPLADETALESRAQIHRNLKTAKPFIGENKGLMLITPESIRRSMDDKLAKK